MPETSIEIETSTDDRFAATHFADARFALAGADCSLPVYWLAGYGGGTLLPIADATSGATTYGGGRYLLDSIKGADLGESDGRLVLDFKFLVQPVVCVQPPVDLSAGLSGQPSAGRDRGRRTPQLAAA